jgi:hypothetical protein
MVGGWGRLHNEKLHNMYTSPNIIQVIKSRRMRYVGHTAHMVGMRNAHNILIANPEGKRPPRRPTHKWEDNIRMVLKAKGW